MLIAEEEKWQTDEDSSDDENVKCFVAKTVEETADTEECVLSATTFAAGGRQPGPRGRRRRVRAR